ncbi:LOW QUALITY PROTEIN: hypothetical protein QC764_117360 [Podospora pseudoanserina]|uniref:Uncharacterized protein n=1 Tax=Podospora pseudoanserina TaxID=2609844 RepID=A0ABR0IQ77_9PEZI|nr:LOW QUALITY PROTEIN: hypothetical protein QC764_117360 [Podospora pseudoanserina]
MIIPASRPLLNFDAHRHPKEGLLHVRNGEHASNSEFGTAMQPLSHHGAFPMSSSLHHRTPITKPHMHLDLYSRPAKFYHYPAISQKLGDRFPSAKRHPPTSSRVSTAWGFGRYGAKSPEATLDGQALDAERLMRPVLNTEESLILAGHHHEKMRIGMDRDKPSSPFQTDISVLLSSGPVSPSVVGQSDTRTLQDTGGSESDYRCNCTIHCTAVLPSCSWVTHHFLVQFDDQGTQDTRLQLGTILLALLIIISSDAQPNSTCCTARGRDGSGQ